VTDEMTTLLVADFAECPLKNFDARTFADEFDPDELDEFVRSHNTTLESLSLYFGRFHALTFPE